MEDYKSRNRLAREESEYVNSYKDSLINWYSWGNDAFRKSERENKLIFLSIGHSGCEDCQELKEKVFSQKKIVDILNENYVSVLVDKDERPDVARIYMLFTDFLMVKKNWPLNIVLTPERIPIYMSVMYKEEDMVEDLYDVLLRNKDDWKNRREDIIRKSHYTLQEAENYSCKYDKGNLDKKIFEKTREVLIRAFNRDSGGFYSKPKILFPQYDFFLLKYYDETRDPEIKEILEISLNKKMEEPIFDHIGFGFFRYSKSFDWSKPFLNKNLKDNLLMASLYASAYDILGDKKYAEVSSKIFLFILRDLLSDIGLYYNSLTVDKSSYSFTKDDIVAYLGENFAKEYSNVYDFSEEKSMPKLSSYQKINPKIESMTDMMIEYRKLEEGEDLEKRIMTSSNGMAIASLSYSGQLLGDSLLLKRAKELGDRVYKELIDDDFNIYSRYIDGRFFGIASLGDYASLVYGYLNLHRSTGENFYLDLAFKLNDKMVELYWDEENVELYYNKLDNNLVMDLKDYRDSILPSASAITIYNWIRLYNLTGEKKYYKMYRSLVNNYSGNIIDAPQKYVYTILTLFFL